MRRLLTLSTKPVVKRFVPTLVVLTMVVLLLSMSPTPAAAVNTTFYLHKEADAEFSDFKIMNTSSPCPNAYVDSVTPNSVGNRTFTNSLHLSTAFGSIKDIGGEWTFKIWINGSGAGEGYLHAIIKILHEDESMTELATTGRSPETMVDETWHLVEWNYTMPSTEIWETDKIYIKYYLEIVTADSTGTVDFTFDNATSPSNVTIPNFTPDPGVLNVTGEDLAPTNKTQGRRGVEMLNLSFYADGEPVTVESITINLTGTNTNESIKAVKLLEDRNQNSMFEPSDHVVDSKEFPGNKSVTFGGPGNNITTILNGTTKKYLIVYDISSAVGSTPGETIGACITSDGIKLASGTLDTTNFPFQSTNTMILEQKRAEVGSVYAYLNKPVYLFGKYSRYADNWADFYGSSAGSGVIVPNNNTGPDATDEWFGESTTIKVNVLVLDGRGCPLSGQNVTTWIVNDDGLKIYRNGTTGADGRVNLSYIAWNDAGDWDDNIWAKFTSRETYHVYIDVDGDGEPEKILPWMAYCMLDTYPWPPGHSGSHCEDRGSCGFHYSGHVSFTRSKSNEAPACEDCHGWGIEAGKSPIEMGTRPSKYALVHPRPDVDTYRSCQNSSCHRNVFEKNQPIPGYPNGIHVIPDASFREPMACSVWCHGGVLFSFASPGTLPLGLAWDGEYLWNADCDAERIYKLYPNGTVITSVLSPGSGPTGLTWDGEYLWNADKDTDKIYKFNPNVIKSSVVSPTAYGDGLTWDGEYFWYTDWNTDRIYKLYPNGTEVTSFSSPGTAPSDLAWDNDSLGGPYLWHADSYTHKIYKLHTNGTEVINFTAPADAPSGVAWDGEYLWTTDYYGSQKIYKLYPNGTEVFNFTSPGNKDPMGLTWDGEYLWNADSGTDYIYKLYPNGTLVASFKSPDTSPNGLAWDGEYLWNADSSVDQIYQLYPNRTISSFASPDKYLSGLTWDGEYLWCSDCVSETIYKLYPNGTEVAKFSSPEGTSYSDPMGLTWDGEYLWNAEDYDDKERIYKLYLNGTTVSTFVSPGVDPTGLTWDGEYLWVADYSTDKIYKLNPTADVHNADHFPDAVECKYCHSNIHQTAPRMDVAGYNIPGENESYPGTCFEPCHITQTWHNNTVECGECHANCTKAPMYKAAMHAGDLKPYSYMDCSYCHANESYLYEGKKPLQIRSPLHHSDDVNNGTKWGAYWTPGDKSACYYCHGNASHLKQALGPPLDFMGNNTINSSISSGNWCAGCHYEGYQNGTKTYDDMVLAFQNISKKVPPEITRGTYAPVDPDYYDHTPDVSSNWSDSKCFDCHRGSLLSSVGMTVFMHNVIMSGGPDCIGCHDIGGVAPSTIDIATFKRSVHANLNSGATNSTELTDMADKACWACHGRGVEAIKGHPSNYKSPRNCEDCHVGYVRFNASKVSEHYVDGEDMQAYKPCWSCHKIGYNTYLLEIRFNKSISASEINEKVSHYGEPLSETCISCHQNTTAEDYGVAKLVYKHANNTCITCHASPRTSVTSLHDENLTIPLLTCKDCHTSDNRMWLYDGHGRIKSHYPMASKGQGNTLLDDYTCEYCHGLSTTQKLHSSNLAIPSWGCADCHMPNGTGPRARYVHPATAHKSSTADCITCHGDDVGVLHEDCGCCHNSKIHDVIQMPASTDCTSCHPSHRLERSTCLQCHQYHLHAIRARVFTPYGWFKSNDSAYASSDVLHPAHKGDNVWARFATCAPCHGVVECDKCHVVPEVMPTPIPTPTVMPTPTVTPTPTPTPRIPGFGAVFAIAGLLAVAYSVRRREE